MTSFLRSPGQASINYGLGTLSAVRPKGLFFVRFKSPVINLVNQNTNNAVSYVDDIGFIVKSVDQPKITVKTEELSQYNKKRQVHTGYDLSPVTITLTDTVDGRARNLWQAYMRFYFGDFYQQDIRSWSADQISNEFLGGKVGFGLSAQPSELFGEDGRYFFQSVEIIQVYGGLFTKSILVNPRIQSFEPDSLDYEDMAPTTFRMSLVYEAVMYQETTKLSQDSELLELFGRPGLEGDLLEVESTQPTIFGALGSGVTEAINDVFTVGNALSEIVGVVGGQKARAGIGGVLAKASSAITFGSLFASNANNAVGDLTSLAKGKQTLKSVVKGLSRTGRDIGGVVATGNQLSKIAGINASAYDRVNSSVPKHGSAASRNQVTQGVLAANQTNPGQANITTTNGLDLSDDALGAMNASRPASAQLGKRHKR